MLFRGANGFHLHVRWIAGDPEPGSGIFDPGPGTWKLELGTQRRIVAGTCVLRFHLLSFALIGPKNQKASMS